MKGFSDNDAGRTDTGIAVHHFRVKARLTLSRPKRETRKAEHSMYSAVEKEFPHITTLSDSQFENIESRVPARQKQLTLTEAYQIAHVFHVPVLALMVDLQQPYRQARIAEPDKVTVMEFVARQLEPTGGIDTTDLRKDDPFTPVKTALRLTELRREIRRRIDEHDASNDDGLRDEIIAMVRTMSELVASLSGMGVIMHHDEQVRLRRVIEDAADVWDFDWTQEFAFDWRHYGRY